MITRNNHSTSQRSADLTPTVFPSAHSEQPYLPQWLRAADDHTLPVSPRRLHATLHYAIHPWYRVPKALLLLAGRSCRGCWHECSYTLEGGLRIIDGVYSFGAALHHEKGVELALGTTHAYRAKERHINARRSRGILIAAALGALCILGLWLGFRHPTAGALAGIGLAAVLDALGRRGRAPRERPAKKPTALAPGTPGTVLWGQLSAFLQEQDLAHAIQIYAVRPDPWRQAFHVDVHTQIEIDAKLLRALEKRIYVRHGASQLSTCPTNAADKTITIQLANPLRDVPQAPWIPAGSVSGWQPLDLGASTNRDCPFELVLVMRNILLVSRTRGGKSVTLSTIIDRLSATRDVVPCAGALIKSSLFDSWRSVLHRKAENVEQLTELLQWLVAQIQLRDQMLKDINSDDDPSNDVDKWDPSLGPAIVCVLDEFPWIAKYDGTKIHQGARPNLLALAETIMRTGSGLGVSLVLSCQASGNEDWGSSVIYKQATVKIIGPCTERDTVDLLGKDKRDQGYAPHLLQPADEHNINDAGMAVVDGPGFGADYVRTYAPFKVKARAIRREQEWKALGTRPTLPSNAPTPVIVINAEARSTPALDAVDAALRHYNAWILSSTIVIQWANAHGDDWTSITLAAALRTESSTAPVKTRDGFCEIQKKPGLKCYYRADVDAAIQALEEA